MNKREKENIKKAAYHEAGHIVFGLACGITPSRAAVSWRGIGFVSANWTGLSSLDKIVMYSIGHLAKMKCYETRKISPHDRDRKIIALLTGKRKISLEDINTISRICLLDVWLEENWRYIKSVAVDLQLWGVFYGSDCKYLNITPSQYRDWLEERTGQSEWDILNDVIKSIKGKMPTDPQKLMEDLEKLDTGY